MHAHMHAYSHMHMHTHAHTQAHTHACTHIHTHIHTYKHTCACTHIHKHIHMHTLVTLVEVINLRWAWEPVLNRLCSTCMKFCYEIYIKKNISMTQRSVSEWVYTLLWKDACYLNKSPTLMCLAKKPQKSRIGGNRPSTQCCNALWHILGFKRENQRNSAESGNLENAAPSSCTTGLSHMRGERERERGRERGRERETARERERERQRER